MNTEGGLSNQRGQGKGSHRANRVKGGVCWGGPWLMPPEPGGKGGGHGPEDQAVEGFVGKPCQGHFRRAFDGNRIGWALWKCRSDCKWKTGGTLSWSWETK